MIYFLNIFFSADNLISGTYYSTSLMLLKEHEYAKELLGHPIKTKFIDLGDQFNVIDGEKGVAQVSKYSDLKMFTVCCCKR